MATAKKGDKVRVHYTGTLLDGTVFDSSRSSEPLEFTLGTSQVITGFEKAVQGLSEGEKTKVIVPVAEAYGERRDDLIIKVQRSQFPADINPEIGMNLRMQQPDGNTVRVSVTEADEKNVILDANHPLAGEDLVFEIELLEILAA